MSCTGVFLHPLEPDELALVRAALAAQTARLNAACPLTGCTLLDCRRHLGDLEDTLDVAEAATRGRGTTGVRLRPAAARALVFAVDRLREDAILAALGGADNEHVVQRAVQLRERLSALTPAREPLPV